MYDSSNVLVRSDSDFTNLNGSASLADNVDLPFTDVSRLSEFQVGNNGPTWSQVGDGSFPFLISYQGCIAIRTADWCGPYTGGV